MWLRTIWPFWGAILAALLLTTYWPAVSLTCCRACCSATEADMTAPTKPVLLTGASGNLGRHLAAALAAQGWQLRLTDIAPFPDPVPQGATFVKSDLNDGVALIRQAEGCAAILHFGGVSVEKPFEEVLGPNIRGIYHVYEARAARGARG